MIARHLTDTWASLPQALSVYIFLSLKTVVHYFGRHILAVTPRGGYEGQP
jgi:hypothetical protein